MNLGHLIAPTSLRDFAKNLGWSLVPEAIKDRIYVMTNERFERRQLVFPMDASAPDYDEAITIVVEKLASLEERPIRSIIDDIVEVGDDGLAFRVVTPHSEDFALPLAFAGSMVAGAQQLLLAAACTVLKPQPHHPRLSRVEAEKLLIASKFRHTRPGSFVLNISCPVQALDVEAPLLPGEDAGAPFVRRATAMLYRSVRDLVNAIETDSLAEVVAASKNSARPVISSNLCEALTKFGDETLNNSVEIGVRWAGSIPRPKDELRVSKVRIQRDYFSRIEEVRRELRSFEQHIEGIFPATVERLLGEMGPDGRRLGEVILSLLTTEGELVLAHTNLTADQYAEADKAHMIDGGYVLVRGKLRPGRQPRQLIDISHFSLLPGHTEDLQDIEEGEPPLI